MGCDTGVVDYIGSVGDRGGVVGKEKVLSVEGAGHSVDYAEEAEAGL